MRPKGALKENFSIKRHPLKWRNWNKLSLIKNFNYRHQINNLQSSKAKCLSQAQMTQPNCVQFVCNSNLQSVSIWLTTLSKPIFKLSLTAILKFKKSRANIKNFIPLSKEIDYNKCTLLLWIFCDNECIFNNRQPPPSPDPC